MELIKQFIKTNYDSTTELRFDNDRNIISVSVVLDSNFTEFKGSEITIKYAKNGVTTDLIHFGTATI